MQGIERHVFLKHHKRFTHPKFLVFKSRKNVINAVKEFINRYLFSVIIHGRKPFLAQFFRWFNPDKFIKNKLEHLFRRMVAQVFFDKPTNGTAIVFHS